MEVTESTEPQRGRFIVLEGPDGGGKTTQVAALATWLRAQGRQAISCRDPGQTALGERIRALLLHDAVEVDPLAELMLFSASRSQLVSSIIRPALEAGIDVVSDRYVLSTIAYQGYGNGITIDRILAAVVGGGCDEVMPDLTIVLDVDPAVSAERRAHRKADNIERRDAAFHARVRQGFLEYRWAPLNVVIVEAGGGIADVAAQVRGWVQPLIERRDGP